MGTKEMQAHLHSLGLHVADAWGMFRLLDADSSSTVERQEFVSGCIRLKANATRLEMELLMSELVKMGKECNKNMRDIKKRLDLISGKAWRSSTATMSTTGSKDSFRAGLVPG